MKPTTQYFSSKKEEDPNNNNNIHKISTRSTFTTSPSPASSSLGAEDHQQTHHLANGGSNEADGYHKECSAGRERLRRFREEVAGRVLIPEAWGQENFLKDWTDCSIFDKLLDPNRISSAREALVADQGRKESSAARLGIASRC